MKFARANRIQLFALVILIMGVVTAQDTQQPVADPGAVEEVLAVNFQADCSCDNKVCPIDYWGDWDGIYYYSGPYCQDNANTTPPLCDSLGFYWVTSETALTLSDECDECASPTAAPPSEIQEVALQGMSTDRKNPKPSKKVGPRREDGDPGEGNGPDDTFRRGPRVDVLEDLVVKLNSSSGARFFRVLKLKKSRLHGEPMSASPKFRWVGLEVLGVAADLPDAITAEAWNVHSGETHMATVVFKFPATGPSAGTIVVAEVLGTTPIPQI